MRLRILMICMGAMLLFCGLPEEAAWPGEEGAKTFTIVRAEGKQEFSLSGLEALGVETISSPYFDRAMDYRGSRFRAVSFSMLVERYDPERRADAVLLNCFDDYQGIVPVADIQRYDLRLATAIEIQPGFLPRPGWLNPLLVLVPEGKETPFQERFLTANIRELRFVNLQEYYAPLTARVRAHPQSQPGFESYKNNCQFCHSLKGVGGNKGGRLPDKYDFAREAERLRFQADFQSFHNKNNQDKQNVEQFLSAGELTGVADFLRLFAGADSPGVD